MSKSIKAKSADYLHGHQVGYSMGYVRGAKMEREKQEHKHKPMRFAHWLRRKLHDDPDFDAHVTTDILWEQFNNDEGFQEYISKFQ